MTRLQLLCLAAAAALLATASAHAAGDKAAGRKLVYTCAGCHGVPGYTNAYPQYPVPKIAGQNEQYIVNALHEYQGSNRTHPTMTAQAESLSDTDIENIAAYLSSLAPAAPKATADQTTQRTKVLDDLAKTYAGTKAKVCSSCHGADGNPADGQYPRLAGQYNEYLQQILHEYQDGRRNNPIMKGMAAGLSDKDIANMAQYYSNLPVNLDEQGELSTLKGHIQGDK